MVFMPYKFGAQSYMQERHVKVYVCGVMSILIRFERC